VRKSSFALSANSASGCSSPPGRRGVGRAKAPDHCPADSEFTVLADAIVLICDIESEAMRPATPVVMANIALATLTSSRADCRATAKVSRGGRQSVSADAGVQRGPGELIKSLWPAATLK